MDWHEYFACLVTDVSSGEEPCNGDVVLEEKPDENNLNEPERAESN